MKTITSIAIGLVLGWLGMSLILDAMSIPDVHYSYSTSECVKVLNYAEGDKYSCENLPTKFNHVWIN